MTPQEHIKQDAKQVEDALRATGDHLSANKIKRLRKAYACQGGFLKQLHADNMALRAGFKTRRGV